MKDQEISEEITRITEDLHALIFSLNKIRETLGERVRGD